MLMTAIGGRVEDVDTPALLLDLDAFDHNVQVMSGHMASRGVAWRPHAKAFKCPAIAHRLRKAGAIGVTVAKVSEAEVMAAGGIDDILIAHLVVGAPKVARLAALQRQADVKVTVDHPDHLRPLAAAARKIGVTIGVLVDVDLGMGRTGVATIEAAVALARQVAETPGLRFEGLMGYEGHTLMIPDPEEKRSAIHAALGHLITARDAVHGAGLHCRIVSAGGSGSYQIAADVAGVTEMQAGGGIFACMYYVQGCGVTGHKPALTVLSTVVSRPGPDRAILDIGHKAISAFKQDPVVRGLSGSRIRSLSAEHTIVEIPPANDLAIGTKVHVVPGYSDFTFVLHNRVLGHRAGVVEASWEILGRGMLQ